MSNIYYISHGGPGSGRYPLGSGERPYQKFETSRRESGGIKGYIKSRKAKKVEAQKQREAEERKQKELEFEAEKRRMAANKEQVLRSGTASEVMKYQGQLTNKELNEAAERIRLEKQLSGYSSQEVKSALDKLKKVQAYTNVGSALAKDGIELWNSFASVYNATSSGKKDPLTLIGSGGGKKK